MASSSMDIAPDYVEGDRCSGEPWQVIINHETESGNALRFLNRLQQLGYEVSKEYASQHVQVYNVYPQPDRQVPSNRMPPSVRGDSSDA